MNHIYRVDAIRDWVWAWVLCIVVGFAFVGCGKQSSIDHETGENSKSEGAAARWVDPVTEHIEFIEAVPIEDRAYPLLARFYTRWSIYEMSDQLEGWVESAEAQELVGLLVKASECSILGMPLLDYEDPIWVSEMQSVGLWGNRRDQPRVDGQVLMFNTLLPIPAVIVQAGNLLSAEIELAIKLGDSERFEQAFMAWYRLALFASEPRVMIGQMVTVVECSKIQRLIAQVLMSRHLLSEGADDIGKEESSNSFIELSFFEDVLSEMHELGVFAIDLDLENQMLEDIVRRLVDESGAADFAQIRDFVPVLVDGEAGDIPSPSLVEMNEIEPELLEGMRHYRELGDAKLSGLSMPWEPIRKLEAEELWGDEFVTPAGEIAKTLFPVVSLNGREKVDRGVWLCRSFEQYGIGLRVAIGAYRHFERHGVPAALLKEIDRELVDFDTMDGFTGFDVMYRWEDGKPLVYALGPDGDDDAGRRLPTEDESGGFVLVSDELLLNADGVDGDMVLFPLVGKF